MNTIDFISKLNTNAVDTFRKLAAIAFEANKGLKGTTYTVYTGKGTDDVLANADDMVYGLKFIAMQDADKKVVGSSMLVRTTLAKAPLDLAIPMNFVSAIPDGIATGPDGHLRWRTSAPPTKGDLYEYLVHGDQCLIIDPKMLKLDGKATDIQVVFVGGYYHINIPTEKGYVYEAKIHPHDVRTNGHLPQFQKLKLDISVTTLLTVPQKGELVAFFGTNNGVYFGKQLIPGTNDLKIVDIVVDSEQPRIFFTTEQGKIFGIRLDINFLINGDLAAINDIMVPGERIFAGPAALTSDKTVALLAIQWLQQDQGFKYQERVIPVPQMFATIDDVNGILV